MQEYARRGHHSDVEIERFCEPKIPVRAADDPVRVRRGEFGDHAVRRNSADVVRFDEPDIAVRSQGDLIVGAVPGDGRIERRDRVAIEHAGSRQLTDRIAVRIDPP